jgi:glycosyltransferase involved in cell wall biosynthesis
MKIYYFTHITGTDAGISGIPRVVKNLGRELFWNDSIDFIPVSWSHQLKTLVHTEQKLLDNLAGYDGPQLRESSQAREPIAPTAGDWLLFAEVPHLTSHDRDYPSLSIDEPIGYARQCGIKVAVILHDIMPLTFQLGPGRRRAFADLTPETGDDLARLHFAIYAHALAQADLVLPVSQTSGELLNQWLIQRGHSEDSLPPILPILLPEEVFGLPRVIPRQATCSDGRIRELLTVGTVCTHKNQLLIMTAFQRLLERRPELAIRLNIVGVVSSESAVPASIIAKRAKGRIVLHGHMPDPQLERLMSGAHASIFVSLAEGYGLPVAESLWHGKPCICSNEGSIAEIAKNGGCMPVDPRSVDEIETAIETLATDGQRYDQLLQQIVSRKMKNWKEYTREIVEHLRVHSTQGSALKRIRRKRKAPPFSLEDKAVGKVKGRKNAVLVFSSSRFTIHNAYSVGRQQSLRHGGAIRFDRALNGEVQEDVLFFGPYAWLPTGRYSLAFDGEVEGELVLSFTADEGVRKIERVSVTSFDRPFTFELLEPANKFEIVGIRTPNLERMVLRHVLVDYRSSSEEELESKPTRKSEPVYAYDDSGNPLSVPFTIAADTMRVHDAFGFDAANRLRMNSTITFTAEDHAGIEAPLFFGPYLRLEPGNYNFQFRGELDGQLKVRLTRNFTAECLLETVLASFAQPIRLKLEHAAEKFEIIADRTNFTRSMVLRSIEVKREPAGSDRVAAATTLALAEVNAGYEAGMHDDLAQEAKYQPESQDERPERIYTRLFKSRKKT